MYNKISIFFLVLFTSSCGIFKTAKLLKRGTVEQKSYTSTAIDFVFDEVIKLPVQINGKLYTFIFDTGSSASVISESLAKNLELKPKAIFSASDSQNNATPSNVYLLDEVLIGDVKFVNQRFIGADFSKMGCFGQEFDGIIGASLMSKAIWFIDNENKRITITDCKNKLNVISTKNVIRFKTINNSLILNLNVTPFFNLEIPGLVNNKMVLFDMGSSGEFTLDKKIVKNNLPSKIKYSVGNSSLGLFGKNRTVDTTYYCFANKIKMDNSEINENLEIKYRSNITSKVGMSFLKNYNFILDWKKKEITLYKIDNSNFTTKKNYDFKIGIEKSDIVVVEIVHGSEVEEKGLKLGDKILEINGFESDSENLCDKLKKFQELQTDILTLKVLQNGILKKITLSQN